MNENSGVIYVITNKINDKQYIGQAICISSNGKKRGSKKRWDEHVKNANNNRFECRLLENAINKYGADNFIITDLLICNIEQLNSYEDKFIIAFNTLYPKGYNLMTGGGNGRKHSIETKKIMSETRTGMIKTDITKQKISSAHKSIIKDDNWKKNIGKSSKYRNISDKNKSRILDVLKILNLEVLPMYIYFSIEKSRKNEDVETIKVNCPNIPTKKFSSVKITLDKKITLAIEYINFYKTDVGQPA
jgi:group I intron endonuclease